LGLGFFLVKLELVDDFDRILKGGPWFIGEHFLSLCPWIPDFRPPEAAVNTVAVWVRLPKLLVEYYDKESLLLIGQALRPVLRVDFNTTSGAKGRFARLCIQLDLDKPLVKTVRMGRVRQAVVYEGIGLLCFNCGRIRHKLDRCSERGGPSTIPVAPDTSSPTSPHASDDVPNSFGPWMLVTRRKRQIKPSNVPNAQRGEMKPGTSSDPGSGAQKNKENKTTRGSPKGKDLSDNIRAPLSGPSTSKSSDLSLNQQTSLKPKPSSIQSQPKNVQIFPPYNLTPSNPNNSISLRPQKPETKNNHELRCNPTSTVISRPSQLDNSGERQDCATGRQDNRANPSGPASHLGMVPSRDGSSMDGSSSSRDLRRLSRSPSPRRLSLASREQSLLEFPRRPAEDSRGQQCTQEACSAISRAEIISISGRGPLSKSP
jgi:hypothetical protein